MISLIVAASTNNVIGVAGDLPWHLSADLKRFKELTVGKPVVMGRKTFESIGRPLPERRNIVMSRDPHYSASGCEVVTSPEAAVALAGDADELMVIGGAEIYARFLPLADRIYLTRVHAEIEGDSVFDLQDDDRWQLVSSETHSADAEHRFAFDFLVYERR